MKKTGCVIIALFLAVCVSLFLNLAMAAMLGLRSSPTMATARVLKEKTFDEQILVEGKDSSQKIAVIPLEGIIGFGQSGSLGDNMVEDFKNALKQALNDKEIKAVVISVDSPGGEVTASDVLYDSLKNFTKRKPAVVYFNAIGASGAYYTACGGTYLMSNATTFTGSIGVIISTLNYRELFGKIGLQSVVFKSGKFKDMLNGAREMTPEEKAYIEGLVMQSYERFLGIVSAARKVDAETLRNGVADGRILSGTDAYAAKLVDQLGYIEDAYAKARELGNAPGAEVVRYKRTFNFENFFRLFGETEAPSIQVDLLGKAPKLEPGRIYLLPPFFAP